MNYHQNIDKLLIILILLSLAYRCSTPIERTTSSKIAAKPTLTLANCNKYYPCDSTVIVKVQTDTVFDIIRLKSMSFIDKFSDAYDGKTKSDYMGITVSIKNGKFTVTATLDARIMVIKRKTSTITIKRL